MRVSKDTTAANRARIVAKASRLFRECGIDGIGIAELMKEVGLTHGGFYRHFASKEALVAEACRQALDAPAAGAPGPDALAQRVSAYLSPEHRADRADGCPLAALAGEVARGDAAVQEVFADGIRAAAGRIAASMEATDPGSLGAGGGCPPAPALALLSGLVGALVLARAVKDADPALSDRILDASRVQLLDGPPAQPADRSGTFPQKAREVCQPPQR